MRISSRRSLVFQLLLLQCSDIGIVSAIPSQVLHSACAPEAAAQSFDYLIVGGGTAGLVLANRLTENADLKVAVIEAGTNAYDIAGNWTQVPGYAGKFNYGAPELSWGFDTTPQKVRAPSPHILLNYTTSKMNNQLAEQSVESPEPYIRVLSSEGGKSLSLSLPGAISVLLVD